MKCFAVEMEEQPTSRSCCRLPLMRSVQLLVGCCPPLPSGRQRGGDANMCRGVSEDVSFLGEVLLSSTVPPMRSSLSESLAVHNDFFHGFQLTFLETLALQNYSTAVWRGASK